MEQTELKIYGPTIEGIGEYPVVETDLQAGNLPLFVAGDAGGMFRGIVGAMVSGDYTARRALSTLQRRAQEGTEHIEKTTPPSSSEDNDNDKDNDSDNNVNKGKDDGTHKFYVQYTDYDLERVAELESRLAPLKSEIVNHELWDAIETQEQVAAFTEVHCFAVWDFMTLLKALQTSLTCVDAETWHPPRLPELWVTERKKERQDSR